MFHPVRLFSVATAFVFVLFSSQAFGELQYFVPGEVSVPSSDIATESASSSSHPMSGGGPADGYDLHVQAPHLMADGTIGGPFHHYCKAIPDKKIFQCLLFETTGANAPLVAVEYFVAKDLSRTLPIIQWHRYFHDHQEEIETGRLFILDVTDENKIKAIAEAAGKTDGVIYHLWHKDQAFPDGTVTFPQSIGVQFPQPN